MRFPRPALPPRCIRRASLTGLLSLLLLAPLPPFGGITARARAAEAPATAPRQASAIDKSWLNPYFRTGKTEKAAERYRLDDFGGAVAAFEAALEALSPQSQERMPATFMLAMSRMNAGRWAAAAEDFERLYASYPLLADYHAYYAARCHLRAGNAAAASTWAQRVNADSVPDAEAQLVGLEALEHLEQWEALERRAEAYLQKHTKGPRRAEARFRLAWALEKQGRKASLVVPHYRSIWSHAATEAWADRAAERIDAILKALPKDEAAALAPTAQDWFERAMALHEKHQNVQAEPAFAAALEGPLEDPRLACEARFYRAQAVFKLRQRPAAAPHYEDAELHCRAAGHEDLVVKSLYQGARCRASGGQKDTALAKYAIVEKEFPNHSYADDARVRAAELLQDAGDLTAARALLEGVPQLYPAGDMLGEALFRLAFAAYEARDWTQALHWLDENLRLIPRETQWFAEGRALYWKGRVFHRLGKLSESRAAYEAAIREYPLSYYALIAFGRLHEVFPRVEQDLLRELRANLSQDPWPVTFGHSPAYGTPAFSRAVELARMGLGGDARRELARVNLGQGENEAPQGGSELSLQERALWLTSVLLDRGRVWNASHAIPRYTLTDWKRGYPQGERAAAWRLSYPRAYPEYVATHSKANGVPQFLQLAIMREESAFSPTIESFANAIGLTQMLVKTAQRFSDTTVTRQTLLDPASNIALGSKFLGFLLNHFNRVVPLSIPGYNAGEGAVNRWLAERGNRPLDEFIETIPYDETRGYTKRVLSTFFTYTWLYGTGDPVPRLSFNLQSGTGHNLPKRSARRPQPRR